MARIAGKTEEERIRQQAVGFVDLSRKTWSVRYFRFFIVRKTWSVPHIRSAVDVINTLAAAQRTGRLKLALDRYLKPAVLILDLC